MNPILRRVLRLLFGLGLVLLLLKMPGAVSLAETVQALNRLLPSQVLVLGALNAAILLLQIYRWRMILLALGFSLSLRALSSYRLAGFAAGYFTPGMQLGGEPLRVYLLRRHQGLPLPAAAAAVTLDRLLDLVANLALLTAGLALALSDSSLRVLSPGFALPAVAGPLLVPLAYLLSLRRGWLPLTRLAAGLRSRDWGAGRVGRLARLVSQTEQQIAGLVRRSPGLTSGAFGVSGLAWALMAVEYGLMLRYLGVEAGLRQVMAALAAARLAFLSPLPAGLGALEAGQALAMQALGAGAAAGIAASLLIRARDLILGAVGLWLAAGFTRPAQPAPATIEVIQVQAHSTHDLEVDR